jgi:LCP family protein required for cell wall assembly
MILVSINQKTETIYLTSFLRDCYVYIPGYGNTRLNHSFAYGGPALVEETLETNFKVHIDRYVAVDFYSFMDVIDTLGGVWIEVSEEEQKVTNQYIWSMNKLMGEEWSNDYLWTTGWMKLNGKQALCYARNRYTGNDYERTQRQRTIISQIITGAKSASPSTLVDLAQVILPQVTTDMTKSEILSYCANVAAYMNYDIVQQQIPVDGSYSGATISGMSVISLNLDKNIQYLKSTIYAGTEYGD